MTAKRHDLPVLVYHKVGLPPKGSKLKNLWVSPKRLKSHIGHLKKRGYNTIGFSDLARALRGGPPLPSKPVLITFDDGYKNNYTGAFGILKETGAKANIFIVYNTVGKNNSWHDPSSEPWINMLDWNMIKEMQSSGLVEFGSHTMNHPNLCETATDEVSWEARESKKRLEEKLDVEITAFAYPYGAGACIERIRRLILEAGYLFDFSFSHGKSPWPWKPDMGPIKRLFIKGRLGRLSL